MALRVITGLRKGHKLKGPKLSNARPTEDRIKESIFNIMEPFSENFIALDLFAATGNIGIEFLSRGANKVYFSELDTDNIKLIEDNLHHTKFTDKAVVLKGDFRRNLLQIRDNIDFVYIDPPYEVEDYYRESFKVMLKMKYFKNALFITEMNENIDFTEDFDKLELVYEKKYGKKHIKFYREKE